MLFTRIFLLAATVKKKKKTTGRNLKGPLRKKNVDLFEKLYLPSPPLFCPCSYTDIYMHHRDNSKLFLACVSMSKVIAYNQKLLFDFF